MIKPITNGYITSGYGNRTRNSKIEFHPGIDISSKEDKPIIKSAFRSEVVTCGWSDSFGNRIWAKILEGPYIGLFVVYAHMSSLNPLIKVGYILEEGQNIGIMGNTGLSTGAHLHFEIGTTNDMTRHSVNPVEVSYLYNTVSLDLKNRE